MNKLTLEAVAVHETLGGLWRENHPRAPIPLFHCLEVRDGVIYSSNPDCAQGWPWQPLVIDDHVGSQWTPVRLDGSELSEAEYERGRAAGRDEERRRVSVGLEKLAADMRRAANTAWADGDPSSTADTYRQRAAGVDHAHVLLDSNDPYLKSALFEAFKKEGAAFINFYRCGPYCAKVLFKYGEGYWTIQSEAPSETWAWAQEELEDWLYTDLIEKQLSNKLMQIRQQLVEHREEASSLYRVYWHPRHDAASIEIKRVGVYVGTFLALSIDHAQEMAKKRSPNMPLGWFHAVLHTANETQGHEALCDEYRPENEGRVLPHELRELNCFEEFFIEARRNWRDKTWHRGLRAGLRAINAAPFGWGLEDGCMGEDLSPSLAKNSSYHNGYVLGVMLAEDTEESAQVFQRKAVERIKEALKVRKISYEKLYISDAPARRGALFNAAGVRVLFPEGEAYDLCYIALVDPDHKARWGHPAHWAFVPMDDSGVAIQDTNLPEHDKGPVRLELWDDRVTR